MVNVRTNIEETNARLSTQKTKCESTKSIQKNQRPKSIKEQVPLHKVMYNSFKDRNRTNENEIIDPQKVPTGPNHRLNKNINKQCSTKNIGANENREFSKDKLDKS